MANGASQNVLFSGTETSKRKFRSHRHSGQMERNLRAKELRFVVGRVGKATSDGGRDDSEELEVARDEEEVLGDASASRSCSVAR